MDDVKSGELNQAVEHLFVELKFKTGGTEIVEIPLGRHSAVYSAPIVKGDVLQLLEQAFSLGEDAFLVLPVMEGGHIFLEPSSLDYAKALDNDPRRA